MFQMTTRRTVLAAFLFCALLFVACGDDDSSFVPNGSTEPVITPEEPAKPDSIAEPDTTTKDTVKADTTAPEDTTKADTTAEDSSSLRISMQGLGAPSSNLYLSYPADSFLTKFEIGDIVTVAIVGHDTLDMPVAENSNDVPIAWFLVSAIAGADYVSLAVHNGQFNEIFGITDTNEIVNVVVSMKEKGGFLFGLDMRYAQYMSGNIESYPELSVEATPSFLSKNMQTSGKSAPGAWAKRNSTVLRAPSMTVSVATSMPIRSQKTPALPHSST